MPYYEYVCSDCNSKFEIKRCISEIDDPALCPECNSDHVSRQISRVAAFAHGSFPGGCVRSQERNTMYPPVRALSAVAGVRLLTDAVIFQSAVILSLIFRYHDAVRRRLVLRRVSL